MEDAVGGTPTAAVGTTALPKKSLMVGAALGRTTKFFGGRGVAPRRPDGAARHSYQVK
jgi:hypothetical protein